MASLFCRIPRYILFCYIPATWSLVKCNFIAAPLLINEVCAPESHKNIVILLKNNKFNHINLSKNSIPAYINWFTDIIWDQITQKVLYVIPWMLIGGCGAWYWSILTNIYIRINDFFHNAPISEKINKEYPRGTKSC